MSEGIQHEVFVDGRRHSVQNQSFVKFVYVAQNGEMIICFKSVMKPQKTCSSNLTQYVILDLFELVQHKYVPANSSNPIVQHSPLLTTHYKILQ